MLSLLVYLANARPLPEVDCVAAPYMAWSFVQHGDYRLERYPQLERLLNTQIYATRDGGWASIRPPGTALAVLPFVAPFALIYDDPIRESRLAHLGKLAAAIMVAGSAVLFFGICQRLAPRAAWPATILYALGTCLASVATQAIWMHGPAVFWLVAALDGLTRSRSTDNTAAETAVHQSAHGVRVYTKNDARYLWIGFALGCAVLTRPTAAFFVVATMIPLLLARRFRPLLGLSLGGLLPGLLLLHYNGSYFGNYVVGGYEHDHWNVSPPLWLGLSGLLIAPSRGVFVYSPALLFAFFGVGRILRAKRQAPQPVDVTGTCESAAWQPYRALLAAWFVAAIVTLVFYARWYDWRGGWCYGPRFLCETMPILCLLFAIAYASLRSISMRRIAVGLVALSVAIHMLGIYGYRGHVGWQQRHDRGDQGRCMFELHDTQIAAHARALFGQ